MGLFRRLAGEYEQVAYCHDAGSGLQAVIAIHSTVLGPGLGGTRFRPYPSEDAAVEDVLRLAEGMTYKAAAAGLDFGGGKAVIIGDPHVDRQPTIVRRINWRCGRTIIHEREPSGIAMGEYVNRLTRFVLRNFL